MAPCGQSPARRTWVGAATEVRMLRSQRPVLVATTLAASWSMAADAGGVRVASSPDVQVFVDAGSLAKDSRGLISVWTKTVYASPQPTLGIPYAPHITHFLLDPPRARS